MRVRAIPLQEMTVLQSFLFPDAKLSVWVAECCIGTKRPRLDRAQRRRPRGFTRVSLQPRSNLAPALQRWPVTPASALHAGCGASRCFCHRRCSEASQDRLAECPSISDANVSRAGDYFVQIQNDSCDSSPRGKFYTVRRCRCAGLPYFQKVPGIIRYRFKLGQLLGSQF